MAENRDILRSMLEDIGIEVALAEDGRQVLDLMEVALPDVAFLDIRMPVRWRCRQTCSRVCGARRNSTVSRRWRTTSEKWKNWARDRSGWQRVCGNCAGSTI